MSIKNTSTTSIDMSQVSSPSTSKSGIIRQSCDACGKSHVRCQPRDGQACVRCHEKRFNCNFSVSRRGPPKPSYSSYSTSHDTSTMNSSEQPQQVIEQYSSGQDGTYSLPQPSLSPQDSNLSPEVSLEQFIAWCQPSLATGDHMQDSTTGLESWDCPGLQDSSTATSSNESESSSSIPSRMLRWNFDQSFRERRQSQAICVSCADRSDQLSLHASHGFWPISSQSNQSYDMATSIGMDELLEMNKDTIESITGILECPCSENVLLFEKCSTHVGRVIDWYAEAYMGHNMIIPATVQIGTYFVSPVESLNQTSAIVLAEMHNLLLPLLERIGAVYDRHTSLHDGRAAGLRDPKCHRQRVISFFCSVRESRESVQASL